MRIPSPNIKLDFKLGRRTGANVVGLDIQPGFVAAVQTRVNGSVLAERAAALPLAGDTMRDGEVADDEALSDVLRELFRTSGLSKHVRVGVANQRTVLRTIELPPVTDRKELAAAVSFQAQDQVPMPLSNAVLDFHALGIVETPEGPRQRVVLVAAQRDMIQLSLQPQEDLIVDQAQSPHQDEALLLRDDDILLRVATGLLGCRVVVFGGGRFREILGGKRLQ